MEHHKHLGCCPSITIYKHPCDALPILLCPFLCISFFCCCKDTKISASEQKFVIQMFVFSLLYIYIKSSCYATKATRSTTEILLLIIISTYIKTPWEFTTLPRIFLKTLLFDEVPYIGYQTDYICYY